MCIASHQALVLSASRAVCAMPVALTCATPCPISTMQLYSAQPLVEQPLLDWLSYQISTTLPLRSSLRLTPIKLFCPISSQTVTLVACFLCLSITLLLLSHVPCFVSASRCSCSLVYVPCFVTASRISCALPCPSMPSHRSDLWPLVLPSSSNDYRLHKHVKLSNELERGGIYGMTYDNIREARPPYVGMARKQNGGYNARHMRCVML